MSSEPFFPLRSHAGERIVDAIGKVSDPAIQEYCMAHFRLRLGLDVTNIPAPVFETDAAIYPLSFVELVVIRKLGGKRQVLLLGRTMQDIHWPRMWHIPGTCIRQTDWSSRPPGESALSRLIIGEVPDLELEEPRFVGIAFPKYIRGGAVCLVFLVVCLGGTTPSNGDWVDETQIEWVDTLIFEQVPLIQMALDFDTSRV